MKILVLDRADSWHVKDLVRAAGNRHQIQSTEYDQVAASIGDHRDATGFYTATDNTREFDCVITRAMPSVSLEQIVFRMDWLEQLARQYGTLVVNPAKTVEASVDKYLSLEKIRSAGIPVPSTHVSQTADGALRHFRKLDSCSVVKPIFGSCGRNIMRLEDEASAKSHFRSLENSQSVIYQQCYVEHGDTDLRLFVVGSDVYGMRRKRAGHWVTNVNQGAQCLPHNPTDCERTIAIAATRAVDALIAGIDLVYDQDDEPYVVEVNACPSWKAVSKTIRVDIAAEILRLIEQFS